MTDQIITGAESNMKAKLDKLKQELSQVRTGRANPQILEGVKVEYFGQMVPMKQVAAISVPEARTLEIRPWDPTALKAIETAIQKSDLKIPPQNDGSGVIRLTMPTMTEERRKEMVKLLGKTAEEARVAMRNERRDAIEKIKKLEKERKVAEDASKKEQSRASGLTDAYIKKIDEALAIKEKELSTV
ncbi:MAG: ribosome recycling factor [Elusimicrobia bacterium]|nr:ribosome recycling factor [Elusimicrobiota bacterium]